MNKTASKQVRILAIAPSARGFGYCVMENHVMLECGKKEVRGDKNTESIVKIEKLMKQFLPDALVLQDVNTGTSRRADRIKALHQEVIGLAAKHKCKVALVTKEKLRTALLGDVRGTKHEMAELLAQKYPDELSGKLPPKRRSWENEDGRMDIFDAVGLASALQMNA